MNFYLATRSTQWAIWWDRNSVQIASVSNVVDLQPTVCQIPYLKSKQMQSTNTQRFLEAYLYLVKIDYQILLPVIFMFIFAICEKRLYKFKKISNSVCSDNATMRMINYFHIPMITTQKKKYCSTHIII
jgi:hypothetical protein